MGLKQITIDFEELSKEKTLRCDVDFINFQRNFLVKQYYSFNDLFIIQEKNKDDIKILDNDFFYCEISNVSKNGEVNPVKLNFNERNEEKENYYKKIEKGNIIKAEENDILISKVRPNLKKYVFIDHEKAKYYYTSAFIRLKSTILESTIFNKILYYSLRTIFYDNLIAISRQGKGYPTLKIDDLLYLKFDKRIINKLIIKQDEIVIEIESIEKRIKELKAQIKEPQEIINKVFAREFGFDESLFNEFGKGMTAGTQIAQNRTLRVFNTDFEEISKSKTLRVSTRFHNLPTKKLMDFLDSIETLYVKDVVESYEKGVQPQYNSNGEIPVIKIANLKNGYIDFSETEFVTKYYYNSLNDKRKLKKNDIIICATGKISLGKIDFYNYEQKAITTVDNYIIRLSKNYNYLFFTYFFRSILGCFQIERDYTGATNQIHLYWEQISNFQIPNIPLERQQKIVDEIKAELDKQEEIKKEIEVERNKIDEIIFNFSK